VRSDVIPVRLWRDQDGAVLVEATVTMTVLLVFVLGSIDFLFAFYQWNAATKALLLGARIAAVSDPVADGLNLLSVTAASTAAPLGASMPAFAVRCDGAAATCTCTGFCDGFRGYDSRAMNTIVFGRGSSSCGDAGSIYYAGMCDILPRITAANVVIVYAQTGLGYVGRPNGPAPTISIALQNLPFQFYFLAGLMRLNNINIRAATSIAAEDLSSGAPP
jgi:hypothetical protein